MCIKCEAAPVVASYRCSACNQTYRDLHRKQARANFGCVPRQIWNPETQAFVPFDDREAYDRVRAQAALEINQGAHASATCTKYKLSPPRLRKICVEHGVTLKWKAGSGEHTKSPERLTLEAAVLADARSGMILRDLKAKYPGHEVRYICVRAGVTVAKVANGRPGQTGAEEPSLSPRRSEPRSRRTANASDTPACASCSA